MLSVISQRNYAVLWAAALVSGIGDFILLAALPYYVYAASGSALASAAAIIAETAPRLVFSNLGGVYADRWHRKSAIVACDALQALFLLPLIAVHGSSTLWIVYVSGFFVAAVGNFAGPFGGASIPHVVAERDLPSANAAFSVAGWIGVVVGSPLGGLLLQQGGLALVAVADATSFVAAAALIALVNVPLEDALQLKSRAEASLHQLWQDWLNGLRFVKTHSWLRQFFAIVLLAFLANGIATTILAPFVRHTLGGSAQFFALCRTLQGVGGVAGAVFISKASRTFKSTTLLASSLFALGTLNLFVALLPFQQVMLVNAALSGCVVLAVVVSLTTLVQTGIRSEFRGRVFGTFLTTNAVASIMGAAIGGWLGSSAGPRITWGAGAIVMLIAGVVSTLALRSPSMALELDPRPVPGTP